MLIWIFCVHTIVLFVASLIIYWSRDDVFRFVSENIGLNSLLYLMTLLCGIALFLRIVMPFIFFLRGIRPLNVSAIGKYCIKYLKEQHGETINIQILYLFFMTYILLELTAFLILIISLFYNESTIDASICVIVFLVVGLNPC